MHGVSASVLGHNKRWCWGQRSSQLASTCSCSGIVVSGWAGHDGNHVNLPSADVWVLPSLRAVTKTFQLRWHGRQCPPHAARGAQAAG